MNFERGDIIKYSYLWAREASEGEESGRKYRPTCLVVKSGADPEVLFLFPITSKKPEAGRPSKKISEIECKRGGLTYPSYVMLDECNIDQSDMLFDVGDTTALGSFSHNLLVDIALEIKAVHAQLVQIKRTGS